MPLFPKPIHSDDGREPLEKRMRGGPIQNPDQASDALARVIKKDCAYKEKDRYDSPIKMKRALESVLTKLSVVARSRLVTLHVAENESNEQTEPSVIRASQKKSK